MPINKITSIGPLNSPKSSSEIKKQSPKTQNINSQNEKLLSSLEGLAALNSLTFGMKEKDDELEKHFKEDKEANSSYVDDRIFGFDSGAYCADNLSGKTVREDLRTRILTRACLADDSYIIKKLDNNHPVQLAQLSPTSQYYNLGVAKFNNKTNKYQYLLENLRDMPDFDGVRGKTPLSVKNKKGTKFRLEQIKKNGINTIIDLRAKGECAPLARKIMDDLDMNYVNIPIEDGKWSKDKLNDITTMFDAINSGSYYIGCANGEARTDLAVAINYIFNSEAQNTPELYFGTVRSSRISVKNNVSKIFKLVNENPEVVYDWGWNSYSEFAPSAMERMNNLLNSLSVN